MNVASPFMYPRTISVYSGTESAGGIGGLAVTYARTPGLRNIHASIQQQPGFARGDRRVTEFEADDMQVLHRIATQADMSTVRENDKVVDDLNNTYIVRFIKNEGGRSDRWTIFAESKHIL